MWYLIRPNAKNFWLIAWYIYFYNIFFILIEPIYFDNCDTWLAFLPKISDTIDIWINYFIVLKSRWSQIILTIVILDEAYFLDLKNQMIYALIFLYTKNGDDLQLFWQLWYLTIKISIMFSKKAKMIIIKYLTKNVKDHDFYQNNF